MQIIAILSTNYSGSTLLDLMLGSHSQIVTLGEFHAANRVGCTVCQERECPIWTEDFRKTLKRQPGVHRVAAERMGAEYVVDSSKMSWWFWNTFDEQAQYLLIHLNKAPERIAASYLLRKESQRLSVRESVQHWARINRNCASFIARLHSPPGVLSTRLRYEDLVTHPKEELGRTLGYIGLEYEEGQEEYWNFQHHRIGGNTGTLSHLSPLSPKESGFYNPAEPVNTEIYTRKHRSIFLDDKWRNHLSSQDLETIWQDKAVRAVAADWGYSKPTNA